MSSKIKKVLYYGSVVVPVFDAIVGFIKGCLNIITNPAIINEVKKQEEELKQLKLFIKEQMKDE